MGIELPPIPEGEFIIIGTVYAKPEYLEEIKHLMRRSLQLAESEPGVLDLVVSFHPDEPTTFYAYERYTGREAYEKHTASKEFLEFSNCDFFARPPFIKVTQKI
ncbi:hypothetical protein BGZ61DRAFT_587326 [Ilyonectria robusta]|uniref:uncharacterized protein n=1 Tax=Ilyonectria robusta TaxID=1079257 RepID=UPI001E8D51B6|nr:uncharacterized protein BGZ61DRAFT_587326 [Ilyonectria robusta]KAH8714610.1 hypothetical protein BGZ61DRAFT_587326 [Ilyonectria robusta]